jgi:hypothetical protein
MSAESEDGIWCRRCKKRHGYMSMKVAYEKPPGGMWRILWLCPKDERVLNP